MTGDIVTSVIVTSVIVTSVIETEKTIYETHYILLLLLHRWAFFMTFLYS